MARASDEREERTVKAVRIEEFGGPEVLRTADLPTPEPGEDEIVIELWDRHMEERRNRSKTMIYSVD